MKRSAGSGRTITKGDAGFDAALLGTSFNAQDPGRRPALIVQANNDADVLSAVRQARDLGLKIGICSGGHSWAQNHIRDGGMLIDLSRLNSISINVAGRPTSWLLQTLQGLTHCGHDLILTGCSIPIWGASHEEQ